MGVYLLSDGSMLVEPRLLGGEKIVSWANWDEASEDTLSVDPDRDGTEDLFVIFGEGGNSEDETGRGADLSGVDLVWSQVGAILGNGTYRTLDGADWFDVTTNFRDILSSLAQYGLMFKLEDWSAASLKAIFRWADYNWLRASGTPACLQATVNSSDIGTTVNAIPTSGVLYCYLGCDGSDVMVGFTQSGSGAGGQPTKLSDFAANDRSHLGAAQTTSNHTEAAPEFFRDSVANSHGITAKWHYAVFSIGDPLIDFSA